MTRGPIVAAILQKDNAVSDFRTLIGSTNPDEAAEGLSESYLQPLLVKMRFMVQIVMKMHLLSLNFISQEEKYFNK